MMVTECEDDYGWDESLDHEIEGLDERGVFLSEAASALSANTCCPDDLETLQSQQTEKIVDSHSVCARGYSAVASPDAANTSFGGSEALAQIHLREPIDDENIAPAKRQKVTDTIDLADAQSTRPQEPFATEHTTESLSLAQTTNSHPQANSKTDSAPFTFSFKRMTSNDKSKERPFWSHKLYRGPQNQSVNLWYCRTFKQCESAAQRFLNEPVLGFDMEWKAFACKDQSCKRLNCHGLQQKVSVIQLACESDIALLHIGALKGSNAESLIAPAIRKIIESRDIIKAGVAISNCDAARLRRFFGLRPKGLIELSDLYRLVKFWPWNKPVALSTFKLSLAKHVEDHLGLPLAKPKLRASDWSKPLNEAQMTYAADDAYAGFMVFHVLDNKRRRLVETPSRPVFAEEQSPSAQMARGRNGGNSRNRKAKGNQNVDSISSEVPIVGRKNTRAKAALRKALHSLRLQIFNNISKLGFIEKDKIASDDSIEHIAQAQPRDVQALNLLPGAEKFGKYATQWDIDLIKFIGEHLPETAQRASPKTRKKKNNAAGALPPSQSSDDGSFERQSTPPKLQRPQFKIPPTLEPLAT